MAKTTETLLVEIGADIKDLKTGLKKANKDIGGFTKTATKLGGVLAGVFAVSKIKDYALEMSKLAGEAEGVEAAFARMGGGAVLNSLREATKGTVADLELMRRAVQARNFDIPMKSLASLFEFATKRAQETGESVDFLTNSIVLGIGRKSPLILDNLGISAIRLRKELKGAGTEAATVGDVAEAVGRIAQTEMAKAGKVIETTAIKTAQWGASIDNIKVAVGKELNKALNAIAPVVDRLGKKLAEGFKEAKESIRGLINEFITLYNESLAFRGVIQTIAFVFKTVTGIVKANILAIWELLKSTKDVFIAAFTPGQSVKDVIKKGFSNIKDVYIDFGKDTALNYQEGFRKTLNPEKQIELLKPDAPMVQAAFSNAGTESAKAFTQSFDEFLASLGDLGPFQAISDQLSESDVFFEQQDIMNQINQELIDMGLNAEYVTEQFQGIKKKAQPVLEVLKNNAESFGFALGEMAASGEKSVKRLIQQFINMAQAIFLAKSASLGIVGLIAGLAGFGIIKGLASQIGKNDTYIEGDKLRVVQENSAQNDIRRF